MGHRVIKIWQINANKSMPNRLDESYLQVLRNLFQISLIFEIKYALSWPCSFSSLFMVAFHILDKLFHANYMQVGKARVHGEVKALFSLSLTLPQISTWPK